MFNFLKRTPLGVLFFCFLFSIYVFTMSGQIEYGDEIERYRVAQSIVDRNQLSIRPTSARNVVGVGDRSYSPFELGMTVLEVPLYALGKAIFSFSPLPDVNTVAMLIVGLLNPILTALTGVLLFKTLIAVGTREPTAVALTLIYGLGTIAWPYSREYLREPLMTLLILFSFYAVYRFQKTYARRWLLITGVALGYLVFVKFLQSMLVPSFILYVVFAHLQMPAELSQRGRGTTLMIGLALLLLPILISLALLGAYSLARYGALDVGFSGDGNHLLAAILQRIRLDQIYQAVVGLLFSPEKSVLLYSPIVLLFFPASLKWIGQKSKEAFLCLGLILITFLTTIVRFDWPGGSWWGPRYLAQITPLFIIPIGVMEYDLRARHRTWKMWLALLFILGFLVQLTGALTSDRAYLDITGNGTFLSGEVDFLLHGNIDSLVIYLSPTAWPIRIDPYGILLICVLISLGLVIVYRMRHDAAKSSDSMWLGGGLLLLVLATEIVGFITSIVVPYPRILTAKANTEFVAGNVFLADGRRGEAIAMYLRAIEEGTMYQNEAVAKVNELSPRALGVRVSAHDLATSIEAPDNAVIRKDGTTLSGEESLEIYLPQGQNDIARTVSSEIHVLPHEAYELSGWIKTENVYGSGRAVISIYEDDGTWNHRLGMDIASLDETTGWHLFRKEFTTQSTTQRIFITVSLWKTYGRVWVDGLQLEHIKDDNLLPLELPTRSN
jgi:dolichyl-phosphate-mannose-protein mannosyltransferase